MRSTSHKSHYGMFAAGASVSRTQNYTVFFVLRPSVVAIFEIHPLNSAQSKSRQRRNIPFLSPRTSFYFRNIALVLGIDIRSAGRLLLAGPICALQA